MSNSDWWAKKLGTAPAPRPASPAPTLQPVAPPQQPVHVTQQTHVYDPANPPQPGQPGTMGYALKTGDVVSNRQLRQGTCPGCGGNSYFSRGKGKPVCFECGYPLVQAVGVPE